MALGDTGHSVQCEDVILAFHKPPGTSARGVRQNTTPDKERTSECIDDAYRAPFSANAVANLPKKLHKSKSCRQEVSISGIESAQWPKKERKSYTFQCRLHMG